LLRYLQKVFLSHFQFQNSSDTDLLRNKDNDSSFSIHKLNKKLWRRSDGRLPLDRSVVNDQHSRKIGVSKHFNYQPPSVVLDDLLDIRYPSVMVSIPKTNGIYDEDFQWKRKQRNLPIERVSDPQSTLNSATSLVFQSKVATNVTPSTAEPGTSVDTLPGIKVRDFAFEAHGAKSARVVSEVDVLKHRYTKQRAAHQTPPAHLTDDLSYFDPDWLSDAQNKSDEHFIDILANSL